MKVVCLQMDTESYRKKMAEDHDEVRMLYRQYKDKYSHCKTLRDSYDSATSTIVVFVPK